MLDYIYRMIQTFEQEHGVHPNLLYLNRNHSAHLRSAFSEDYSPGQITQLLRMEIIIDAEVIHPHVAWTQAAQHMAS